MCNKKIESNLEEKKQWVDAHAILALTEQRGTVVPNKFRCIIPRLNRLISLTSTQTTMSGMVIKQT